MDHGYTLAAHVVKALFYLCKVVQVINLNVANSIFKLLDQMFVAPIGSFLPLYVGIPTKPYKRHATGLVLH